MIYQIVTPKAQIKLGSVIRTFLCIAANARAQNDINQRNIIMYICIFSPLCCVLRDFICKKNGRRVFYIQNMNKIIHFF